MVLSNKAPHPRPRHRTLAEPGSEPVSTTVREQIEVGMGIMPPGTVTTGYRGHPLRYGGQA